MKLAPQTFWRLSLPEWRAHLESLAPTQTPLARRELETLMKQYPDD